MNDSIPARQQVNAVMFEIKEVFMQRLKEERIPDVGAFTRKLVILKDVCNSYLDRLIKFKCDLAMQQLERNHDDSVIVKGVVVTDG